MGWLSASKATDHSIACPSCGDVLKNYLPSGDHHPAKCEHCDSILFVFSATARNVAVDVSEAPVELRRFIEWAQKELSELEFISFLVSFEELLGIGE